MQVEGTTPPIRRRRSGRWTLLSGVALIAIGVLSFNAYASFTATASYNQAINSGTMSLVLANETSATINYNLAGTNIAPGDTMQRGLLLTFGGTVAAKDLSLQASDSSPTALDDGTANGLTLTIESCTQKWDETVSGGIPTYACAGSTSTVMAATSVHTLITTPQVLTSNLTLNGANHLRLTWTFPSGAGNAFQNLSDTIALNLTADQRDPVNK
jgi:hypothetical protein